MTLNLNVNVDVPAALWHDELQLELAAINRSLHKDFVCHGRLPPSLLLPIYKEQ